MTKTREQLKKFIVDTVRELYDPMPDFGEGSYKALEDSWIDGTDEIADLILNEFDKFRKGQH